MNDVTAVGISGMTILGMELFKQIVKLTSNAILQHKRRTVEVMEERHGIGRASMTTDKLGCKEYGIPPGGLVHSGSTRLKPIGANKKECFIRHHGILVIDLQVMAALFQVSYLEEPAAIGHIVETMIIPDVLPTKYQEVRKSGVYSEVRPRRKSFMVLNSCTPVMAIIF